LTIPTSKNNLVPRALFPLRREKCPGDEVALKIKATFKVCFLFWALPVFMLLLRLHLKCYAAEKTAAVLHSAILFILSKKGE